MCGAINADVCFSRNGLRHTMLITLCNTADVSMTISAPAHTKRQEVFWIYILFVTGGWNEASFCRRTPGGFRTLIKRQTSVSGSRRKCSDILDGFIKFMKVAALQQFVPGWNLGQECFYKET